MNNNKYSLIEEIKIEELNGVGKLYQHNKSGARVVVLLNDDINKTFSIAFRTPPTDNTGLPHILEHSVLCGSEKFPVKDPFVELAKGSLNTFLNAMTFSDKTMYPVASCNDKDFENLMDVYLDAVFFPNIYKEPKIFKQEGWHYSLESEDDNLEYTGVVYNEMKGAFSSPERVLMRQIQLSLFPDNAYGLESGGYPDDIPALTNEDFLDFHKKYYHPSNSYVYLYGDIDEAQKLNWLDENYLGRFDRIEIDSSINKQVDFNGLKEVTEKYPISSNESTKDKAYLAMNYVISDAGDKYAYYANEILEYVLFEAPGAPIKEALLKANICNDVFSILDNNVLQPTLSIVAKGTNEESKVQFVKIIDDEIKRIVKEGIDKEKLQAAINYFEFRTREADFGRYPKGVMYAITSLDSWLYDKSPFIYFEINEIFEYLHEGVNNGYFDGLVKDYFIENPHSSFITLLPDTELTGIKEAELKAKLAAYKDGLSHEEKLVLIKETKELLDYQNAPETKEAVDSIPLLKIDDINKEINKLDYEETEVLKVKVLKHLTFTNNISYNKLLFSTKHIEEELIPYIGLLRSLLGMISTKNYSYSKLSDQVNIHTGGISISDSVYSVSGDKDAYHPYLEVSGKSFIEKIPKLYELIDEIIFNTDYSDTIRIKEIIYETKSRHQMRLVSSGHVTAINRSESYYSNGAYYNELLNGVSYLNFLEEISANFDQNKNEIIEKLKKVAAMIFDKEDMIVAITVEEEVYGTVEESLKGIIEKLGTGQSGKANQSFDLGKKNEGYMTSGNVQYVGLSGNFIAEGYDFNGSLMVLKTILSLDYLWNNVRVKGGAYGAMMRLKRNGSLSFVSYRDPNLTNTLNTYKKIKDYIENLQIDERELSKYIIGTISDIDQPLTKSMENSRVLTRYLTKLSNEQIQKERDEILGTTLADVVALKDLINDTVKQENICVVGSESVIKNNEDLFESIKYIAK